MSIEKKIEELTKAINGLCHVIQLGGIVTTTTENVDETMPAKVEKEEPAKVEKEKPKAVEEKPATTDIQYDDVKEVIIGVSRKVSRDAAIKLLGDFGASKGDEVKVEDYARFIEEGNALLNGAK